MRIAPLDTAQFRYTSQHGELYIARAIQLNTPYLFAINITMRICMSCVHIPPKISQTNPGHLQDLAAFLGLDCSPDDAATVLRAHQYGNPPGEYTSVGLTFETLQWMNATMSAILPEAILSRYGLSPTDT